MNEDQLKDIVEASENEARVAEQRDERDFAVKQAEEC